MTDRFAPDWTKVEPVINHIEQTLHEHLLIDAFSSVADPKIRVRSIQDVKRSLRAAVGMGAGTPWILYDTISTLLQALPRGSKSDLAKAVKIEGGRRYEHLEISPEDGRWQISWEIDPSAEPEYQRVRLDWYLPLNHEKAPLVPIAIMDCIAGCVLLLRENLVLPATAALSIALESTLWDALEFKGISRYTEQITFTPVQWTMKKSGGNALINTITGADADLQGLQAVIGDYPPSVTFEIRRMQANETQEKVGLRLDIDKQLVDFFASSRIERKELVAKQGLSVAIQKARSEDIQPLQIILPQLDKTLVSLRNNLIHLSSKGKLHEPVPIPGQGELQTTEELRSNHKLVRTLLPWVVEFINAVYVSQTQPEEIRQNN